MTLSTANAASYMKVTARLIATLETGTVPWVAPMKRPGIPTNALTRRYYSGVNLWALLWAEIASEYTTSGWLTFNQAQGAGLTVRAGERSQPILFMQRATAKRPLAGEEEPRTYFVAKTYSVFNLDQLAGDHVLTLADGLHGEWNKTITGAEQLVAASGARVINRSLSSASYNHETDTITMPPFQAFLSADAYYVTLFHELIHWTGHATRLARRDNASRYGDEKYALEELIAELGAAFLAHHFGLNVLTQSASYLASWLRALKVDPIYLVKCATDASKAVALLLPALERPS